MYNHDSPMNSGSRATPSSRLSTLVCLSQESGASCDTPPFDTWVRPEVQLCLMSADSHSSTCAPTRFVPRWHSMTSSPEAPCANLMRTSRRGFGYARKKLRIILIPIRNFNTSIYNNKLWFIYIKMISMPSGTY